MIWFSDIIININDSEIHPQVAIFKHESLLPDGSPAMDGSR